MEGGSRHAPLQGNFRQRQRTWLGAPVWGIENKHRGIHEGVLEIKLGAERPRVVPEGVIGNYDGARGSNAPGEFVQLLDGNVTAIGGGGHPLHVAAEIANLVEGVPGGHLKVDLVRHAGDFDGDVEEMLLGMSERDGVANLSFSWIGEQDASRK